jgi:GntR family transcriptional regulator/MocR family aminotransferase
MLTADPRTPSRSGAILMLRLDRQADTPLSDQIYAGIRAAIESGRLHSGAPLPSSRALARDLGVARSTIVLAYDHLRKEGYVDGALGRVNRVTARAHTSSMRGDRLANRAGLALSERRESKGPALSERSESKGLSRRGARIAAMPFDGLSGITETPRAFRTGVPALDLFPVGIWQTLLARAWRRSSPRALGYGDPFGYAPLRQAISHYLGSARGLSCSEEQILICAGSQQAINLCAQIAFDPGDAVWMEDPGYAVARHALTVHEARIVPVPVDDAGLDVEAGIHAAPDARLAYVTPARQCPLGVTMSVSRREQLLAWARAAEAWILEDDYDAELRYASRPPAPLRTFDADGRVIFAGTFSKILFPALRLGYLVVPPRLVEVFRRLRVLADFTSPYLLQAAVAEFITEGHFERHIRRMRTLYQRRQALLVHVLKRRLGGRIDVASADAGMNLVVWLPPYLDDRRVVAEAKRHDLDLMPLSALTVAHHRRPGLLLGFGGISEREIVEGVDRLERVLDVMLRSSTRRSG